MKTKQISFGRHVCSRYPRVFSNVLEVRSKPVIPSALRESIRDPSLEEWFHGEAFRRIANLDKYIREKFKGVRNFQTIKDGLEMDNRLGEEEARQAEESEMFSMKKFCSDAKDILERVRDGLSILRRNPKSARYLTVAKGMVAGGAGTRAQKWVKDNPKIARQFGLTVDLPRPLSPIGGRTALELSLEFSRIIARSQKRIIPNIVMVTSEDSGHFSRVFKEDFGNFSVPELEDTLLLNPICLKRLWVPDFEPTKELYPAGHGCYPYLMAKYGLFKILKQFGIKHFLFSNPDEWLWQADPVMISIAEEIFKKGTPMLCIVVDNINNQLGAVPAVLSSGKKVLIETPRLPWSFLKEGGAPKMLNTTFYDLNVDYFADNEEALKQVKYSLTVKEVPERRKNEGMGQIVGVESFAEQIFSSAGGTEFIKWPRLNFLGIKDGSFITGAQLKPELGGRSYLHYVNETVVSFPHLILRLIGEDVETAAQLIKNRYSYIPPVPKN